MLEVKNKAYFVLLDNRHYKEYELIMVSTYLLQSTWLQENPFYSKFTLEISTNFSTEALHRKYCTEQYKFCPAYIREMRENAHVPTLLHSRGTISYVRGTGQ